VHIKKLHFCFESLLKKLKIFNSFSIHCQFKANSKRKIYEKIILSPLKIHLYIIFYIFNVIEHITNIYTSKISGKQYKNNIYMIF